jgi:hypothetical protein
MKLWLGKLQCWWAGKHLRGKKIGRRQLDKNPENGWDGFTNIYQCPRCLATWTRKVKAKQVSA